MNKAIDFEHSIRTMAEQGAFDMEGIEQDREQIIDRLLDAYLDTGWAMFNYDGTELVQIQRVDDEGIFDSDEEAIEHVKARAEDGSERHKDALVRHDRDAPRIKQHAQEPVEEALTPAEVGPLTKEKDRVWIEFEKPTDDAHALRICAKANRMMDRLGDRAGREFTWGSERKHFWWGDSMGAYELVENGHWFNLDYLGRE